MSCVVSTKPVANVLQKTCINSKTFENEEKEGTVIQLYILFFSAAGAQKKT